MRLFIQKKFSLTCLVWLILLSGFYVARAQLNETDKLTASDAAAGDIFGIQVDISGNYAIVGAYNNSLPGSGAVTGSGSGGILGATYIFKRNPGGHWNEVNKFVPAYLYVPETGMGAAVAIDGDLAASGAVYLDNIQDAVYIYKNTGGTWEHLIRLHEPILGFGSALDISGNRVIVGAPTGGSGDAFGRGKAFIYEYSGDPGYMGWTNKTVLLSSDAPSKNFFGQNAAIHGDFAAVTAGGDIYNNLAGNAVFIFERDGSGNWNEVQKITPPTGSTEDGFGVSLAISGNRLIIGASGVENAGVTTGTVYVYERTAPGVWSPTATLFASDGAQFDSFGFEADIHNNKIIVGSRNDDDDGEDSGSAYLFTHDGTSWNETAKYTASDAAAGDRFGRDVGITDYYAIAGALSDDDAGMSSGSAYILQHQALILPGIFLPRLIIRVFPNPNFGEFIIGATIVKPFEDNPKEELSIDFIKDQQTIETNWSIVPKTAKLSITTSSGEEILSQKVKLPYMEEVDLTYYGPGIYYVTIDSGDMQETVRVIVEAE